MSIEDLIGMSGIVYNPPNISAIDAELLAWAKGKAKNPIDWGLAGPLCLFCKRRFTVTWEGAVEADHSDGCLALRANTVKP